MSSLTLVPTLVRPSNRVTEAIVVGCALVLLALSAQLVIPLPFTPVPITGQTFAVLLVGASFGTTRGLTCIGLYLLVGMLGAPVFSQGRSGLEMFTSPSAGYLVGMLAAVWLVARAAERGWDRRLLPSVLAMVAGTTVIYAFGLVWLGFSLGTGVAETLTLGLVPFLVGDAVKIALAAAVLPATWKAIDRVRN